MEYSLIKNNINRYSFLAPDRILGRVDNKRIRGLLASDEGSEAGILIFENEADKLKILWLYVLPGFRRRGVGDGLIADMLRRLENKEIKVMYADLPEEENCDFIQSYFSRLGFRFEKNVSYELMVSPKELEEMFNVGSIRLLPGISSLSDVNEELVIDFLEKSDRKEAIKIYRENIPKTELDISCVHLDPAGKIDALLLIVRSGRNVLMPVLLETERMRAESAAKLVSGSLYLCRKALEPTDKIYISCTSGESRTLVSLLFDDVHPVRVRHGVLRG